MTAEGLPTGKGLPTSMIARLIPRYAEPHRRYHTWSHIAHVFDASERISEDRSQPLALAIFYHDAVYDPLAADNEERSARLLLEEGQRAGVPENILREAAMLVRLTRHAGPALDLTERACVLLDSDLAILGEDEAIFDRYEEAIRQEYAAVPNADFAAGRSKILAELLSHERIYKTERGRALWEAMARKNITRSIRHLDSIRGIGNA